MTEHDAAGSTGTPDDGRSSTARLLDELQLHGWQPNAGEADPRPMPTETQAVGAIGEAVEALAGLLTDTCLEGDLDGVLWSFVNLFHRRIASLDRELDGNEQEQRRSQREQDGSEVKSVELERLIAQGVSLTERRNAFEAFREIAADRHETLTGSPWRPWSGSLTSRRTMTAAVIDSRDFLAAKRRAETEPLLPAGPLVAFTGGTDCNDHTRIWDVLDRVRAKHPGMALLHGGTPKGAERIAAAWADNRNVQQIVYRPDWTRHGKAAPFRRNDAMLEAMPLGVIVFPGSGISQNLADKARKAGIAVWRFDAAQDSDGGGA